MPSVESSSSQITAYSFAPFIELTADESKRLSAMTRNAKNVIYTHGFLVNTKKNKNGWRITDNKYIEANRGLAAGRPINYGPKVLGKAHHPNFYHDLDLSNKTPEQAREEFLQYQEWSRIGDILRIDYDQENDRWIFDGAISHPNIVEAVQKGELQLPKYVSPYFWNLNDPDDTGDEIREAELFHVSFVDDPAYGPEAVAGTCNPSEDGTTCAARVMGLPAGKGMGFPAVMPPCARGLMASIKNKLDSSFYVETPNLQQIQDMSDPSTTTSTPKETNANKQEKESQQPATAPDQAAREAALATMKKYDEEANKAATNIDNKNKESDPKNPTIPVEYQEVLNMAIEKDRAEQQKGFTKALKEREDRIAELEGVIKKYEEAGREAILDQYIDKDTFKDEAEYKKRRDFYANLSKDLKMTNEQLEELMKGHYQVQEVKYLANKKGKGAGSDSNPPNTDPFGFNNREDNGFGKLSNSRGLAAATDSDQEADEDILVDDDKTNNNANAILGAF